MAVQYTYPNKKKKSLLDTKAMYSFTASVDFDAQNTEDIWDVNSELNYNMVLNTQD
jgi:hypothetical protein